MRLFAAHLRISLPTAVEPVKASLAMRVLCEIAAPASAPEAVDDINHASGQNVLYQLHHQENGHRGLLGGLHDHAVTRGQRWRQFQAAISRGSSGNDLAHHAVGSWK